MCNVITENENAHNRDVNFSLIYDLFSVLYNFQEKTSHTFIK